MRSIYGIFSYIWLMFMVNVGTYTIHGSYRYVHDSCCFLRMSPALPHCWDSRTEARLKVHHDVSIILKRKILDNTGRCWAWVHEEFGSRNLSYKKWLKHIQTYQLNLESDHGLPWPRLNEKLFSIWSQIYSFQYRRMCSQFVFAQPVSTHTNGFRKRRYPQEKMDAPFYVHQKSSKLDYV